jgi:hypothetical protein
VQEQSHAPSCTYTYSYSHKLTTRQRTYSSRLYGHSSLPTKEPTHLD